MRKVLLTSSFLFMVFGWIQYFIFPDLKPLYSSGWDDHYYRLAGTLFDPGFTGLLLIFSLIIFVHWKDILLPAVKSSRIAYAAILAGTYSAIILTYSRASFLAALAAIIAWAWIAKSIKILLIGFALLAFTVWLIPKPAGEGGNLQRTSTVNFRLQNWQQSLQIARDFPFLGVGFNRYRYAQANYNFVTPNQQLTSHSAAGVDNSFLFVLATTGIIGFLSYCTIWLTAVFIFSKPPITQHKLIAGMVIAGALIHAQFHNTLFYAPIMAWVWTIIGLESRD